MYRKFIIIFLILITGCSSNDIVVDPIDSLKSLPYVGYTDIIDNKSLIGVVYHDVEKAYDGYNFFNGKLIDMKGNIINSFAYNRIGEILPNGNYIAQRDYETKEFGLFSVKNDLIWGYINLTIHHKIAYDKAGNYYVITKETKVYNKRNVEFDVVLVINSKGEIIDRWSTYDNLEEIQQFHPKTELDTEQIIPEIHRKNVSVWGGDYDYYHMNHIEIIQNNTLSDKYDAFQEGNWLISFRHGSLIIILDKDTKKVKWFYGPNNLQGPHTPHMLENGNVLIFDNGRYRNYSRIIEVEPVTLDVEWEYKKEGFFTYSQGSAQRLPNGNTLITETDKGHVFEVTYEGEIVWDYYHPLINSNGNRKSIYKMVRYDKEYISDIIF